MTRTRGILCAALLALAALYAWWFARDGQWVAVVVFALPPLLLALSLLRGGGARTGFWAGVLALLWFSHGIMVAWTRAPERGLALAAVALAVAIVLAASLPGLRARFGARSRSS
uniref:DUF2069 domain-containing protein n=1 Tax=uncultured bacterium pTW2 TaxID=504464 RepID=B8PZV5_9BACT|nr:hypothetical protein [uncultured bacterium pTW2]